MRKKYNKYSDTELLKEVAKDNQEAFEEIYRRYQKELAFYAYGLLGNATWVGDVLQDVFAKLWDNRYKTLPTISLKAYLYQMVRHKVMDHFRSLTRENISKARLKKSGNAKRNTTEEMLTYAEYTERFDVVFAGLSEENRKFYRFYENTDNPAKVARYFGVSEKRVRNRFYALKSFIKKQLGLP